MNSREYRFVVVRDANTRKKLADALPYCKYAADPTAVVIVVVANLTAEIAAGTWPQNCAGASLSLVLGATTQGVGATWTAVHPDEDRKKSVAAILGIPKGFEPFSAVVFGYPPVDDPLVIRPSRFEPSFVHTDHW